MRNRFRRRSTPTSTSSEQLNTDFLYKKLNIGDDAVILDPTVIMQNPSTFFVGM